MSKVGGIKTNSQRRHLGAKIGCNRGQSDAVTARAEIVLITIPSGGAASNGDWVSFGTVGDLPLLPYLNIDSAGFTPGPIYNSLNTELAVVSVNILSTDTAAQVATAFFDTVVSGGSFDGSSVLAVLQNYYTVELVSGTQYRLTATATGPMTNAVAYNMAETNSGSITVSIQQQGI